MDECHPERVSHEVGIHFTDVIGKEEFSLLLVLLKVSGIGTILLLDITFCCAGVVGLGLFPITLYESQIAQECA